MRLREYVLCVRCLRSFRQVTVGGATRIRHTLCISTAQSPVNCEPIVLGVAAGCNIEEACRDWVDVRSLAISRLDLLLMGRDFEAVVALCSNQSEGTLTALLLCPSPFPRPPEISNLSCRCRPSTFFFLCGGHRVSHACHVLPDVALDRHLRLRVSYVGHTRNLAPTSA